MANGPKFPWYIDTNERFREVVRLLISLSTAAMLLPMFFAREFLQVPDDVPLSDAFGCIIYVAWGLFIVSIFTGLIFQYLSAKWIHYAWGQDTKIFFIPVSGTAIERIMDWTFWGCVGGFLAGIGCLGYFFSVYVVPQ